MSYYDRDSRELSRIIFLVAILLFVALMGLAYVMEGQQLRIFEENVAEVGVEGEELCRALARAQEPFIRERQRDEAVIWTAIVWTRCGESPDLFPMLPESVPEMAGRVAQVRELACPEATGRESTARVCWEFVYEVGE